MNIMLDCFLVSSLMYWAPLFGVQAAFESRKYSIFDLPSAVSRILLLKLAAMALFIRFLVLYLVPCSSGRLKTKARVIGFEL